MARSLPQEWGKWGMGPIDLKIEDLILDHDNPRITHAEGQQEALQKIIKDQKTKLVKLAQSIAEKGLNPMDRFLVLRVHQKPERFIALEGNRRTAVFKLLSNPAVMSGLDMSPPTRAILERLANGFKKSRVEPIPAYEMTARQDGDYWLELRHKGELGGMGIVDWTSAQSQRFRTRSPAIQALDMVTERGGLSTELRDKIADKFPITTLQRFVEDKEVRRALGLDVRKGKLVTTLPAKEALKPLKRIVTDLATKKKQVGDFMKSKQMLDYISGFDKTSAPDLSKAATEERALDEIPIVEFGKPSNGRTPRRKLDPSDRREVVPKGCPVNVKDNRISEIYKELRELRMDDAPNAIAVLMRVFLEMSVDYFLEHNGGTLKAVDNGRMRWKKLDKKLKEVIDMLVTMGVPETKLASIKRSVDVKTSPMNVELFHLYVHERFATPSPAELKAAWNNAQPLFEKIWP
jgi:hypothetical protein